MNIKYISTSEESISGDIVNMKLFPHNFTWLDGGKFNLNVHNSNNITQTILKEYDEARDRYHLVVHEFIFSTLSKKEIEIFRMGIIDPFETIELFNTLEKFKKL